MTPQAISADVVDRIIRAAELAKAGRAEETQRLLAPIPLLGLPDDVLQGVGTLHFLSGNARGALRYLSMIQNPNTVTRLAISAALAATGHKDLAAAVQYHAMQAGAADEMGIHTIEDVLFDGDAQEGNYVIPQRQERDWGPSNVYLERGDFPAAHEALEARSAELLSELPHVSKRRSAFVCSRVTAPSWKP